MGLISNGYSCSPFFFSLFVFNGISHFSFSHFLNLKETMGLVSNGNSSFLYFSIFLFFSFPDPGNNEFLFF